MRKCPICKKEYSEHPALSRKDNETYICPECGKREALEGYASHICIFENRYCRYAKRDGKTFNCTAPSDDEMTCK